MNKRSGVVGVVILAVVVVLAGCGGASSGRCAEPPTTTAPPAATAPSLAPTTMTTASPAAAPSPEPDPTLPADAFVRVAVASVWRSPTSARPVDRLALAVPVDIRGWLLAMTTAQRKGLVGRLDTQVLLGDRVVVLERRGDWVRVVVPGQPTPRDGRGYPGWVPASQLTNQHPPSTTTEAVVVTPTAWLTDPVDGHRMMEVSMGTRLPIVANNQAMAKVEVATPDGPSLQIAADAVSINPPGAPARAAQAADVVRTARQFEGLPYLWGGASGFGFDCSGLTYLDYRIHGITIPRDADAQAAAGRPVAKNDLRPGDLIFYATSGTVHHVALAVDATTMVQSPQTGRNVEAVPVSSRAANGDFQSIRRYLG